LNTSIQKNRGACALLSNNINFIGRAPHIADGDITLSRNADSAIRTEVAGRR
jgi:hypothetical protein